MRNWRKLGVWKPVVKTGCLAWQWSAEWKVARRLGQSGKSYINWEPLGASEGFHWLLVCCPEKAIVWSEQSCRHLKLSSRKPAQEKAWAGRWVRNQQRNPEMEQRRDRNVFEDLQPFVLIRWVLGAHPEREAGWNPTRLTCFREKQAGSEYCLSWRSRAVPSDGCFPECSAPGVLRGQGGGMEPKEDCSFQLPGLTFRPSGGEVMSCCVTSILPSVLLLCVYVWRGGRLVSWAQWGQTEKMGTGSVLSLLMVLLLKKLRISQAAGSWLVGSASRLSMTGGEMCFLSLPTLWVMLLLWS